MTNIERSDRIIAHAVAAIRAQPIRENDKQSVFCAAASIAKIAAQKTKLPQVAIGMAAELYSVLMRQESSGEFSLHAVLANVEKFAHSATHVFDPASENIILRRLLRELVLWAKSPENEAPKRNEILADISNSLNNFPDNDF